MCGLAHYTNLWPTCILTNPRKVHMCTVSNIASAWVTLGRGY